MDLVFNQISLNYHEGSYWSSVWIQEIMGIIFVVAENGSRWVHEKDRDGWQCLVGGPVASRDLLDNKEG